MLSRGRTSVVHDHRVLFAEPTPLIGALTRHTNERDRGFSRPYGELGWNLERTYGVGYGCHMTS